MKDANHPFWEILKRAMEFSFIICVMYFVMGFVLEANASNFDETERAAMREFAGWISPFVLGYLGFNHYQKQKTAKVE